ncbi:hypothetical protein ACFUJU_13540 [Streptomyces sp. NPDC057235]|uniref:hypothetical protein n=1 Tax=Streptomyces sp. NPDC057235 TaxID=3346058 RepID=UPI00362EE6EE
MNKHDAIEHAAHEVLAYGGPAALTDPHLAVNAMGAALDLGATHEDIAAEVRRQREQAEA